MIAGFSLNFWRFVFQKSRGKIANEALAVTDELVVVSIRDDLFAQAAHFPGFSPFASVVLIISTCCFRISKQVATGQKIDSISFC